MLFMFETIIRGGICHSINRCVKDNNKYLKDFDKIKESQYLKYRDIKGVYGWAMSQKLPVDGFVWVDNTSQFNEEFIRTS